MKICLVTAFPPSHERVNEYGYHLARELRRNPFLSLTVLADEFDGSHPELPDFDVIRCWRPNQLHTPLRLFRTIRQLRPDVVWYNLVFSTFGVKPAAAFLGLCAPAFTSRTGYFTHVTLHHLIEGIKLEDSGVRFPAVYQWFGQVATRLLLRADSLTVLLPAYRRTLVEKYRGEHVHLRAHGVFSDTPELPDFSRRGHPPKLLAFGKWGTYKRLELLLEAFPEVLKTFPECRLIIAGEDHPTAPGYIDAMQKRYARRPNVEFIGYVAEQDLPELFATATMLVMPYTSTTGASGVAHQACQFGLPIVCADLPDFREMTETEKIAMEFYRPGDGRDLAKKMITLLHDPHRQCEMAEQNYSAAVRVTMPQIVRQYLRTFNWQLGRRTAPQRSLLRPRRVRFAPAIPSPEALLPPPASLSNTNAVNSVDMPQSEASENAELYSFDQQQVRRPDDESREAA